MKIQEPLNLLSAFNLLAVSRIMAKSALVVRHGGVVTLPRLYDD